MKKKLLSLLLALLVLTTTALAASPDILCGAGGRYEAVGAPEGARLYLARYEGDRFRSLERLESLSGTLEGSGKLFLLDRESRPLCPAGELRPQAPAPIVYKAPAEQDIDSGLMEYGGQAYPARYVNNQLVVVLEDGADDETVKRLLAAYGASAVGKIESIGLYQIEFPSAKTLEELRSITAELKLNGAVEDAYPNTVIEYETEAAPYYPSDAWDIPDDPESPGWDELRPDGNNWGAEAINAPSAWRLLIDKYGSLSRVPRVRVGIIDTYIDATHEDLDVNAVYWYQSGLNVFKKDQTAGTAAEYAAAAETWDAYGDVIHGTHVMGTIGASFNNGGINGIALNPELYGVSVAEAGASVVYTRFGLSTALSNLIEDSECQVINYSMGYKDYHPGKALDDAKKVEKVLRKYLDKGYDFLIAASAGNNRSRDARYNSFFSGISDEAVKSRIIVVGNARQDAGYTFSLYPEQSYGERVDAAAPGGGIYSTVSPNQRSFSDYRANSRYTRLTGTSMAAPHVSGAAALVWAANPELTGDQVKRILIQTANIPVDGTDAGGYSHGMINAAYAVSSALGREYAVEGSCGSDAAWILDTAGTLTVQGGGDMSWDSWCAPWYRWREAVKRVNIEDGVTSICDDAFIGCSRADGADLGTGLESIGAYAFGEMPSLHSVKIPAGVRTIGDAAFGYDAGTPVSGFTVYGYPGTAAEAYARDNGFPFISLEPGRPELPGGAVFFNGHAYKIYDERISWQDAKRRCEDLGGHLVTITSPEEQDFLAGYIGSSAPDIDLWTGIQSDWTRWITGEEVSYQNWGTNEPDGYAGQCYGAICNGGRRGSNSEGDYHIRQGEWDDLHENDRMYYICEWEPAGDPAPGPEVPGPFAGGSGTEADPYQIASAEQLAGLSDRALDGETFAGQYFKLTADIDLSAYASWTPIGSNNSNRFQGSFDGNGHRIRNLTISEPSGMYFGLFGYLHNAAVKDLILEDVSLSFTGGVQVIGGITGGAYASDISDCAVSGAISVVTNSPISGLNCGGIAGMINGTSSLTNCANHADIDCGGSSNVGGIVGSAWATLNSDIQILGCENDGSVTGGDRTGEIAGSYGAYSGSSIVIK